MYAGTGYGVFISTNAGTSWTAMNSGLANLKVKALTQNPGVYLFCGTAGAAYRWPLAVGAEESPYDAKPALALKIYPNPCRGTTDIRWEITDNSEKTKTLKVYDMTGRLVKSFTDIGHQSSVIWNGTDQSGRPVPAGVYFVEAKAGAVTETRILLLIR
jgi:hypothetical protein